MSRQRTHLVCHPAKPSPGIASIEVELKRHQNSLELCYRLCGDIESLRIPEARKPARSDGLWQHSCMELFVADAEGPGYQELNFSPSGQWAHYRFSDYRVPINNRADIASPVINSETGNQALRVIVELPISLPAGRMAGLAAVLEHHDDQLSYWALAHPGRQPDFHLADAFIMQLE